MKIVIDAFGGDNAPLEIIKGAALAQKEFGVDIILAGDKAKIESCINENSIAIDNLEILDAPDIISMDDNPTSLLKDHKDSSMAVAFRALAEDKADALVSAGSTGAIVVGGTLIVKRIKGIKRPALASLIPAPGGRSYMLMDMGANADCRPEMLCQFGIMSSVMLESVYNVSNPKVALLNIGTEETKGDELHQAAYKLLKEAPINFVGNVESREMPKGVCDAVVADGFSGNIALKLIEGTSGTLFKLIKGVLYKNILTKLSALMLKKGLYGLKDMMDSSKIGGAMLVGARKPVIKAHGNSNAVAIKNAIKQAKLFAESGAVEKISNALEKVGDSTDEKS